MELLPTRVILDTNALLDWLVFRDPMAQVIGPHLSGGQWQWLACPAMALEWSQVWTRAVFTRWQPDAELASNAFEQALMVNAPPRARWVCKDPDDQVFIDLAAQHAQPQEPVWLFTKDHALLKLARRARQQGVHICSWAQWHAAGAPVHPPYT